MKVNKDLQKKKKTKVNFNNFKKKFKKIIWYIK